VEATIADTFDGPDLRPPGGVSFEPLMLFPHQARFNSGRPLQDILHREVPLSLVLETAMLDCGLGDLTNAAKAYDALIQWLSLVPICQIERRAYVMLKGPVDQMWHAFILHTEAYYRLCRRHLFFFLHHYPRTGAPSAGLVRDTVALLTQEYGSDLHPYLRSWSRATYDGLMRTQYGFAPPVLPKSGSLTHK
jgi:hypothetical protein